MSSFFQLAVVSLVAVTLGGCAASGASMGNRLGFGGTPSPTSPDHATDTRGAVALREVRTATWREPTRFRYPEPVTREITCRRCSR